MTGKVKIIVSEGHTYSCHDREGQKFTSVSYMGSSYGGACPCDTADDIANAIKHAKKTIIKEGDSPLLVDRRENLNKWL